MCLFCCASFYSGFQQLCRGVDTSVTDSCCEKGVPCKALAAPHCPCAGDTFQLGMDGAVLGFGLVPFRERRLWDVSSATSGSAVLAQPWLSPGSALLQLWYSSGCLWPQRKALRDTKAVPQLPWLSLQQPQHTPRFEELHIHFSELKTCFLLPCHFP